MLPSSAPWRMSRGSYMDVVTEARKTGQTMKKTAAELATRWLKRDLAHLTSLEQNVLRSAVERKPVARDISRNGMAKQTFGDRLADSIARVGGSWRFIISFLVSWLPGPR